MGQGPDPTIAPANTIGPADNPDHYFLNPVKEPPPICPAPEPGGWQHTAMATSQPRPRNAASLGGGRRRGIQPIDLSRLRDDEYLTSMRIMGDRCGLTVYNALLSPHWPVNVVDAEIADALGLPIGQMEEARNMITPMGRLQFTHFVVLRFHFVALGLEPTEGCMFLFPRNHPSPGVPVIIGDLWTDYVQPSVNQAPDGAYPQPHVAEEDIARGLSSTNAFSVHDEYEYVANTTYDDVGGPSDLDPGPFENYGDFVIGPFNDGFGDYDPALLENSDAA